MRFLAALLFWLVTTAALAVAVPATWAQHNVVDEAGYVSLAQQAATERPLQDAMASELTTQLVELAANSGYDVSPDLLRARPPAYTAQFGVSRPVRDGQPDRAPLDVHRHRCAVGRVGALGGRPLTDARPTVRSSRRCGTSASSRRRR